MSGYVLGVGCSRGCPPEELAGLALSVLAGCGVPAAQVRALASIDARAGEPAMLALSRELQRPLHTFPAERLRAVEVPNPSDTVAGHVGTPSVAEAAALLASGGGRLVAAKQRTAMATCALACAATPEAVPGRAGIAPARAEVPPRRAEIPPARAEIPPAWPEIPPRRADLAPRRAEIAPRPGKAPEVPAAEAERALDPTISEFAPAPGDAWIGWALDRVPGREPGPGSRAKAGGRRAKAGGRGAKAGGRGPEAQPEPPLRSRG